MNRRVFLIALATVCFAVNVGAQEPDADEKWADYMRNQFKEISDPPSPAHFQLLLAQAATKPSGSAIAQSIQQEAWTRLSSYPNFDKMILNAIRQQREEWKNGGYAGHYDEFRVAVARGLAKIVDPRAVRVLGELLSDTEDTMPSDPTNPPNGGMYAAEALYEMLEQPPVQKKNPDFETDMVTWQLWYEQVKAGNRSFRFKGDPQDYNLQGPLSKAVASSPTLADSGKSPGEGGDSGPSEDRSFPLVPVLLACGILGAGVVVVLRGQRKVA